MAIVDSKADYWPIAEREIKEALARTEDGHLPWSWWQERAQRFGVSPNTIYSRALKKGLYTAPIQRGELSTRRSPGALSSARSVLLDGPAATSRTGGRDDVGTSREASRPGPSSSGPGPAGLAPQARRQAQSLELLAQRIEELEGQLFDAVTERDQLRRRCDRLASVLRRTAGLLEDESQAIRQELGALGGKR